MRVVREREPMNRPTRLNVAQFRALVDRRYRQDGRTGFVWWVAGGKHWSLVVIREDPQE